MATPRRSNFAGGLLALALVIGLGVRFCTRRPIAPPPAEEVQSPAAPAPRPRAAPPAPPAEKPAAPTPSGAAPALPKDGAFARARWGAGRGELGRSRQAEGSAEAPLALVAGPRGEVWVLDQVNGRVARWDAQGQPLDPWPLPLETPRELASGPGGRLALLDPHRGGSVALLGPDGRPAGEVPIAGPGLPDPALATGLHSDDDGVWVEREHAFFVRVADAAGRPASERTVLDGRPARAGGLLLSAAIIDARAGTAWVRALDRAKGALAWQRRYTLPAPILRLALLDSDREGRIAFGVHVAREVAPGRFADESIQLLCLAPDGAVRAVVALPPPEGPEESLRELALAEDGTVLYLHRTAAEARLLRIPCGR